MGYLAPLFERRDLVSGDYDNGGTLTKPASFIVDLLGGGKTASGVAIDEWVAEGLPAVYACVHATSETTGQVPLKLHKKTARGRELATEHPVYWLLHDVPNPELTAYQFREMLTRHLAMWGRAYAQIVRDRAGDPIALWPLHPTRMFVDRDHLNRKRFQYWMGKGDYQEFIHDPKRPPILHLHINSSSGLDGRSPIWINRESLGITKAAEEYVGSWFGNGAIPGIIATHKGKLTDRAKENIRRSWLDKFMGAKRANKFAILEDGIDVKVVGVDPEKSQLDKLRNAQIEAAARIWRTPLFMIQNQTKDTSWGSGIEHQMLGWVNTGLMPYFVQWEQAVSRDLLNQKTRWTHYAKFLTAALTRGDIKTRFDAYAVARQNAIFNSDEIREMEELNAIDGGAGAVFWMPTTMQPMIGDGSPVDNTPEPDAPVVPPVSEPEGVM